MWWENLCTRLDGNWKKVCLGWRWDGQRLLGSFLTKRPLHLVFIKATTTVLDTISSLHMVWVSQINICVVTERMRDKTTGKVNKWPITKATLRFSLEKFTGSSCKPKNNMRHTSKNQCVYTPERWKYIKSKEQFWSRSEFLSTKWTHVD